MDNGYDEKTIKDLLPLVIRACSIKDADKFYNSHKRHYAHARWMYIYAVKKYTNMSYNNIFECVGDMLNISHPNSVAYAFRTMQDMVKNDYTWKERWSELIASYRPLKKTEPNEETITILAPKGLHIEIKRR